jgi:predicted component of type VI protein secretion system
MYTITLEWFEEGRQLSQTLSSQDNTKEQGKISIGRDQNQCDVVLDENEKSVSRLHAIISYDAQHQQLTIKNLTGNRENPNPVIVDGKAIALEEASLSEGSTIRLGKITITVKKLDLPQAPKPVYGVRCVNGHKVPFEYLGDFCPHCGYALQAGHTDIIPRSDK